jgi:hypothetical protein
MKNLTRSEKAWITFRDRWLTDKYNLLCVSEFGFNDRTEIPYYLNSYEEIEFICENSKNVYEIANYYLRAIRESYEDYTINAIIAENLRKFSLSNFRQFGDINQLNEDIEKNYLTKQKCLSIDIQAMEMSECYSRNISPQDIVDFVVSYPKGTKTYVNESKILIDKLEQRFYELTTFNIKKYYCEHLVSKVEKNYNYESEECPF